MAKGSGGRWLRSSHFPGTLPERLTTCATFAVAKATWNRRSSELQESQMIRRREFVGLLGSTAACALVSLPARGQGASGAPSAATAGPPAKIRRIGIIVEGMRSPAYDGFLQGMDALGYTSGKDYLIEWRFADGRFLRILETVGDLAKLNTDLIFVGSPAMIYPV